MNLIFDGHHFFYKTLFAFGGQSKSKKLLQSKKEQEMFVRKVATDVSHAIRHFEHPDKVVFTLDSRSWRKEIPMGSDEVGYKGDRVRDEGVHWDNFYHSIEEFAQIIQEKGFIVSKEKGAECDDLLYLWSEQFLQDGEDSVIITGDGDMKQCAQYNHKNFVVVFNPNSKSKKLITPQGFGEWIASASSHFDLFDANTFINTNKDIIVSLMSKIEVEELNTHKFLLEKIILGDGGDSIPSIWTWKKGEKKYRVTQSKAEMIYADLPLGMPIGDLPLCTGTIALGIEKYCKQTADVPLLEEHIKRNLQLIYLDKSVIPETIQRDFRATYRIFGSQRLKITKYDLQTLLSGSKYLSEPKSFSSDFFSNFE
jgi:5'-3' exonuclease